MKLTHHVREPIITAEFPHEFPQSFAIHRVKSFRQIQEGIVKNATGEDLPGDVEQRDASLINTELPVPLPFVEMDDGRVFELVRNLPLAPHLLEECCEVCHQPGPTVLVDIWLDCVGSRCFTAGNLLHGPDGFW
ncbi:unnamed protein product [Schistocephalus solidus]|uniref:Uncharacterized protein n=1 Tax=Schistocephalus solidus TaxID=70667 RepID=A0A183T7Z8_SCHSO|nr:unnamed protein product [Schistocephalus solidus]